MAIIIKNYESATGTIFPSAQLVISEILLNPITHALNFAAHVYASEQAVISDNKPIEMNAVYGHMPIDDFNQNLVELAENAILEKIELSLDKTWEECDAHNQELYNSNPAPEWLDIWDVSFQRFKSREEGLATAQEDYIEACKILLGEE